MTHFKAVVTEKTAHCFGSIIANTKTGQYKGMSKDEFYAAILNTTCFTFEVQEIETDYSGHREFLNDKWVSAS